MEEEFKEYESVEDGWTKLLSRVEQKAKVQESVCGRLAKNMNLNRYFNVIPYDCTRVKLSRLEELDYINANYVTVSKAARRYILTQGPLPKTIGHFWLMVWEQKSNLIVMLNRVVELDFVKCETYWPSAEGDTETYDDVKLSVTHNGVKTHKHYIIRTFTLTDLETDKSREIHQYNYTAWPDHGAPESPTSLLRLLTAIRKTGGLEKMDEPAVIHCSAGIGRSGTLVLIDAVLCMIENQGSTEGIDVIQTLFELRECRKGLIQTASQLKFAYMTILYGKTILERASKVQAHMTSSTGNPTNRRKTRSNDDDEVSPIPSTSTSSASKKGRKSSKKRKNSNPSVKETSNIFQKNLLTQTFDEVDSDTGDKIFYDLMKPMPNIKKPRSDHESEDNRDDFCTKVPIITLPPLSSIGRPEESSSNQSSPISDSALLRRREQNKKMAEKTAEMKKKMSEDNTNRNRIGNIKKSALYGSIAILLTSMIIYCTRYM